MRNVRFLWGLVGSLVLLLSVVSWAWIKESRTYKTVAVVGNSSITEEQWIHLLKQKYGEPTLHELINQEVVFQEAAKLGISIDQERINKEIEKIKESFSNEQEFASSLKEQAGTDLEQLETVVRYQLLLQELATRDVAVTDEEMQNYYGKHQIDYAQPLRIHAMQIVVSSLEEAQQVQKELQNGGNFSTMAKERSIDTLTAANGGDLGWVTVEDDLPEEVLEVISSLSPKQDSEPIRTSLGFTIIRVAERKEAMQKTFEEVKDDIHREVALAKVESLDNVLERLRQARGVQIEDKTSN